jgi:hypothetical protein
MQPVMLHGFKGIRQAELNWCWAAAAASIYNYYAAHEKPRRCEKPQCAFIKDQIKDARGCLRNAFDGKCRTLRCANPVTSRPEHLNTELRNNHLLRFSVNCDGTVQRKGNLTSYGGFDWSEVRANIDDGCPIGLRVMVSKSFLATISHFLVIIGYYALPEDRVVVWDPFSGRRDFTLDEIKSSFGPLEQKYLTKQRS